MFKVKLADYWGNGFIDIMQGDSILAEVTPSEKGYTLSFSVKADLCSKSDLKKWVKENLQHMLALRKASKPK